LVTDRYGRITAVNTSLLDLVGGDSQQWCGQPMEGMLPVPSRIFLQTHLMPMVLHDGNLEEIKLEVVDRHGVRTPVLVNCKRSVTADTEAYHWVIFVSRERSRFEGELLEARKRAEASARVLTESERAMATLSNALLAAQEKVRLANESGGVGIWDMDLETGGLIWDAQSYRLYGLEPRTEISAYDLWARHLHPDDLASAEADFQRSLATGDDFFSEYRVVWADGSVHNMRGFGRLQKNEAGQAVRIVGTNVDVTEAVNYAQSLKVARDTAEAASHSKGQFLANMSHEIRTPMNAILGMLSLLQSTDLTTRQRDYASKTEGAANSLLGLLNDILDFSKVDAGKMELEREPLRPDAMLRQLAVVLSANVGAKNIEVLFDVDPTLPEVVLGDAMRLQQVLINLCGNAIKFTSLGQVVLALKVQGCSAEQVTVQFSVQDSGIGIAPEHQQHIFSGFSQAEASTTRRFGGTGLGLAICKRLVELMGGQIHMTSTSGVGSTFAFTLTLPVVAEVGAQANADGTKSTARHALVVDDNPIAGALLVSMVRSLGWTADLATSGAQALDLAAAAHGPQGVRPYDVVYMDWQMPEMDGWQATARLQQWCAQSGVAPLRTVMVSAHGRENLSQRSLDEQTMLHGFLVKPVTASMLREAADEQAPGHSSVRQSARGRSSLRQLSGMRVLVVEDNLINQQVAEELLNIEGAVVSLAANGQLGVEAVAAAAPQFDVVLMDVQMPVLDGYGATRAIRDELKLQDLPIIAMTANAMASDRDACLAAGMNEHIGKPFDMAKLVSLLIRMTGFQADVAPTDTPDASSSSPAPDLPVPEVAGLDIQTALNRMSGMRSLYVRTAKDFVKIMDTAVPELQQVLKAGDKQQAVIRLHTLKGNAGTLGATAMAAEAAALEKLCTNSAGMAECEAALARFEVLLRDTQDKMREAIAVLGAEDASRKPTTAETSFTGVVSDAARQTLQNIAALAKAADLGVLQVFAQSRELLGEFPSESIEALDEALQSLDLESAAKVCAPMLLNLNG
jgi:signal transduction histidine kinase/CheY-like chemotaxis protein